MQNELDRMFGRVDTGAWFADGVLTVKVPRIAQAQRREIPVTAE